MVNFEWLVPLDILESGVDAYLLIDRDAHISAVAFHPTRHMAVSSSYGGDFKVIMDSLLFMLSMLSISFWCLFSYLHISGMGLQGRN